jgi:hypothetical protein
MWWPISPVRDGGAERLRWSGKSATPREASPRWVGAPGLAEELRGRPVRFGDSELIAEIEAETTASVPEDSEAGGTNKTQGGGGPFVPTWLENGRDITDGSTCTRGKGTTRCCTEAEHAHADSSVQTALVRMLLSRMSCLGDGVRHGHVASERAPVHHAYVA